MKIGLKLLISILLLALIGLVAGDQPASNLCEPANLHDHAMTHSVSNGRPTDRTTSFSTNDDVAISWVEFGNDLHCSHSVSWSWYSPDGKFFKTDTKATGNPPDGYYYERASLGAPLPIHGYDSADMPGLWKVKVYSDGDYYCTDSFSINPEKNENGLALSKI